MKWEVQRKEGGKDDAGDGVQRESRECHDEKNLRKFTLPIS